jgi:hypothetical protein
MAALGWTPDQFWAATSHDFFSAFEMWREMNPPPKK